MTKPWNLGFWLIIGFLCLGMSSAAHGQAREKDDIEKSIDQALVFLGQEQDNDGSWNLHNGKNIAATSLAVMAFLSAGHVPGEGPYGDRVEKGIEWVLKTQKTDGLFSQGFDTNMYHHGIATLMLAEVSGMANAKLAARIKIALEKAVKIILLAQRQGGTGEGGWRYQVQGQDADLSVTGWQLLALRAAKNVGCDIPRERIVQAVGFIKRCRDAQTGGFCYMPNIGLTIPCTGTAILCLELCEKHNTPEAVRAGSVLLRNPPRWNSTHFFYNVYYCSQATFQLGKNYWAFYRPRLHKVLLENQNGNGSWTSNDAIGTVYGTSMSVLALTVEYRYLPIYQRGEDSEEKKR